MSPSQSSSTNLARSRDAYRDSTLCSSDLFGVRIEELAAAVPWGACGVRGVVDRGFEAGGVEDVAARRFECGGMGEGENESRQMGQ